MNIRDLPTDGTLPVVKALGLIYVPADDVFLFRYDPELPQAWTMRTLVSFAAKLFDPFGFLSPFLMTAKVLIQQDLSWDEALPEPLVKKWTKWLNQAPRLDEVQISRWCEFTEDTRVHVFIDASTAAYAAIAYAVMAKTDLIVSHFLMSKTRVAPLAKQESVARLELSACQLGVILAQKLSSALGIQKSEMTFWTDSSTCLYWLHTKENLSTYVANRVCFILDNTQPIQWKHVTTDQNPADIPTRGSPVSALVDDDLWWTGPEFLRQHASLWREQPTCVPTDDALSELVTLDKAVGRYSFGTQGICAPASVVHVVLDSLDRLSSVSPGDLILRVRALERIRAKLGKKITEDTKPLLYYVIKHLQQTHLKDLLQAVQKEQPLPKCYSKLSPFLHDGILRVGGKLTKVDLLSDVEKYPIILPKNTLISEHIVMDIHRQLLQHAGGPLHLMSQVQRRFWLFGGRAEVTRILYHCHRCRSRHPERHPDHANESITSLAISYKKLMETSDLSLRWGWIWLDLGLLLNPETHAIGSTYLKKDILLSSFADPPARSTLKWSGPRMQTAFYLPLRGSSSLEAIRNISPATTGVTSWLASEN